ncbi:helix-turn-helix domain-containing protein [Acidipropionibacterium timonense]|uniref:helix-turn-helix domain-containing protein n=1 Tax=Acidipropionibacterium timonense TaxID=2161818 RepID=UPI001031149A
MTTQPREVQVPVWTQADRLRKAREFAGLDQTELADAMGVSRASISASERGLSQPRRLTVRAWAMACGVPASWLETGQAPHPEDEGPGGLRARRDSNPQPSDP